MIRVIALFTLAMVVAGQTATPATSTTPGPVAPFAPSPPVAPTIVPGKKYSLPPAYSAIFTFPPQGSFDLCYPCGDGYFVRDKSAFVNVQGTKYNCGEIEGSGLSGAIPSAICIKALWDTVAEACGCDSILYSGAPSSAPLTATTKAPSAGVTLSGLVGSAFASSLLFWLL